MIPTSGIYLCGGVSWNADGSFLALTTHDGGRTSVPLVVGAELHFRILSQAGQRLCLGATKVFGPNARAHFPCPRRSSAERGYLCVPCFARDDLRFMHNVHRSGTAPDGLRKYLAQPHWLYVATFGDGATKIGTAADLRKYLRLAEQGAVAARYVARADDGRLVRVLEDAVTAGIGLRQAVRSSAKLVALAGPKPPAELDGINAGAAQRVRAMLQTSVGMGGFNVVNEQWQPPVGIAAVMASNGRTNGYALYIYPELASGEHGFLVHAMAGPCALVSLQAEDPLFLADLGKLKGRIVELGGFTSRRPDIQEPLF